MKLRLKFVIVTKKAWKQWVILKKKILRLIRGMFLFWFKWLLDIKNEVIEFVSVDCFGIL